MCAGAFGLEAYFLGMGFCLYTETTLSIYAWSRRRQSLLRTWRRLQKLNEARIKQVRRFELRHVARIGNELELGARNRFGDVFRLRGVLRRVLLSADHQRP